jgi:hypothetical protein
MNKLPIEIENKIWGLYYSNIYYTNVILEFHKRITLCNNINEIRGDSPEICLLQFYNNELSRLYNNDELRRRMFQISFYNHDISFYNPIFLNK